MSGLQREADMVYRPHIILIGMKVNTEIFYFQQRHDFKGNEHPANMLVKNQKLP
jgi:hypothetical protein